MECDGHSPFLIQFSKIVHSSPKTYPELRHFRFAENHVSRILAGEGTLSPPRPPVGAREHR